MPKYELDEGGDLEALAKELEQMQQEKKAEDAVEAKQQASDESYRREVKRARNPRTILLYSVGSALVLVGAALLLARIFLHQGPRLISVPNVVGYTVDSATTKINNAKLRPVIKYSDAGTKPDGTVIASDPVAGTKVMPSANVQLTVAGKAPSTATTAATTAPGTNGSNGTKPKNSTNPSPSDGQIPQPSTKSPTANAVKVEVPDVVDMLTAKAQKTVEAAGFKVEIQPGNDAAKPSGVVLDTYPKPKSSAERGSVVYLQVNGAPDTGQNGANTSNSSNTTSSNPAPAPNNQANPPTPSNTNTQPAVKTLKVKDYAGLTKNEAIEQLQQDGISYDIYTESSSGVSAGYVTRTVPTAGSSMPVGQKLVVYVAQ